MGVVKQIIKHKLMPYTPKPESMVVDEGVEAVEVVEKEKEITPAQANKKKKKETDMVDKKVSIAEEIADQLNSNVKHVKKDRGLIERTESSKIVLTEDNRQVLND